MADRSAPPLPGRVLRLARTLRHHRADQVLHHVGYQVRRRLPPRRAPAAPEDLRADLPGRVPFLDHAPWHRGEEIRAGRWGFLNREAALGFPPRWDEAPEDLLWRFHLHGFSYLHVLDPGERRDVCRSWLSLHSRPDREAWHPYPLSQRITHWCRAGVEDPELVESLYRQAAWLEGHLEWRLRGNHLLENARALVLAGRTLRGRGDANRWAELGLELLLEQLDEQVLSDGGHFERSPMYHALALEAVLDVMNVLPEGSAALQRMEEKVRPMLDFLAGVTRPDGDLSRFADTTREVAPSPAALLDYGHRLTGHEPEPRARYPDTGYYRFACEDGFLVVDGGLFGADFLPGHGHADLFSFELDWGGMPWIVDTGVCEYVEGPMRDHVRSTAAHNTVTVDDTDQAECWGSFRVARRYPPRDVSFEAEARRCRFEGRFDGYAELLGDDIVHRRELSLDAEAGELTVRDRVGGHGRHHLVSRLHLHPEVTVREETDGLHLERAARSARVRGRGGRLGLEAGWFCPEFGVRVRNPVVRLEVEADLPVEMTLRLRFGGGA